jgi:hypothetical protein
LATEIEIIKLLEQAKEPKGIEKLYNHHPRRPWHAKQQRKLPCRQKTANLVPAEPRL